MSSTDWRFLHGANAGFGREEFSLELYELFPAYRKGYEWARDKIREGGYKPKEEDGQLLMW